jgi:hypothetical protein
LKSYVISGVVAAFVFSLGGYSAYRYRKTISRFSQDLPAALGQRDFNILSLKNACRSKNKKYCFDAVSASTSWTSSFESEDSEYLVLGCISGDARACRHSDALERARSPLSDFNIWANPQKFGRVISEQGSDWPRVLFLNDKYSYAQWMEMLYRTMSLKEVRKVDIICATAAEFSNALICLTYGAQQTSLALSRIAALLEQEDKVVPAVDHRRSPLLRFWQGYNIRRADFEKNAGKIKSMDSLHKEEELLWKILLSGDWDFLLTFNVFSVFSGIPSHEYYHGIYFESEKYRQTVDDIVDGNPWGLLPVSSFVKSLYRTSDRFVLHNEIQAYAMQSEPPFSWNSQWNEAIKLVNGPLHRLLSEEQRWSALLGEKGYEN